MSDDQVGGVDLPKKVLDFNKFRDTGTVVQVPEEGGTEEGTKSPLHTLERVQEYFKDNPEYDIKEVVVLVMTDTGPAIFVDENDWSKVVFTLEVSKHIVMGALVGE